MAKRRLPCPTIARLLLRYEPETGRLYWKHRPAALRKAGSTAPKEGAEGFQCATVHGYLQGGLLGGVVVAHRVIWAIVHGYWPKQIDHINGIKTDNRLANLREVDDAENRKNMAIRSDNASGFHGVRWLKRRSKWRAEIKVSGSPKYLGEFANKDDAIAARKAAELAYGFHENHGRSA